MACKFYAVCVLLACVLLAGVPLSQGKESCELSLLEAVLEHPDLEELAIVIEGAELIAILDDLEQVTLFAPNNNAFNGSNGLLSLLGLEGASLIDFLLNGNNKAASILLYHIVTKPYTASQLTNGLSLETELSGYNLTVSISSTGSVVIVGGASNATVVTPNIQVCGSVVHIINAVLLPGALSTIPSQPSNSTPGSTSAAPNQAISSTLLLGLVATATSVLLL
ncbi:unnamed protein product [Sphagnum troendelagicum]|uniref:FAS1 domain-containing protein n=1 Tax=Sphagnum troendelagicum TaxID=128251 RepID=A0ABP0UEA2_9BRYO